jgi:hypothetical protein
VSRFSLPLATSLAFSLSAAVSWAQPLGQTNLTKVESVSQFGITWTFDKASPIGRYVNGDYYVVGPVTVIRVDPPALIGPQVPEGEVSETERKIVRHGYFVRNGSMLNPPPSRATALDSGIRNYFKPERLAKVPVKMAPGDCLLSSISLKKGERARFPYHSEGVRGEHDNSPVKTAAILTCVDSPQPEDAFRPAYADRSRKLYLARNLKRDLLPGHPLTKDSPNILQWIRVFERPWVNPCFFGFEHPMENMPHYGQWVGQAMSMAGLTLMLDYNREQKERLLVGMVQVGIDYWGLVRNGHTGWEGWGGHGSGRKFPIVLAGVMLGDDDMASPTRTYPKAQFGEDNQTMFGEGWTGATALFAGHSGINHATAKVPRPQWGPYEHLHPSKWNRSHLQSESYRRANTSCSWVGQALALRMLGAEKHWNHDPFFAYVDRWMTEPNDAAHRAEIMKYHPKAGFTDRARFAFQGYTAEPFVKTMWDRHRGK